MCSVVDITFIKVRRVSGAGTKTTMIFNPKLKVLAAVLLPLSSSVCWGQEIEFSLDLIAAYHQSAESVQVDGKSASFRAGGAGLQLAMDTHTYGALYGSFGGGYTPKQSASFSGVELNGPADSVFYGFGYEYQHPLTDRLNIALHSGYVSYDISGDLDGMAFGVPVSAAIESTTTMLDTSLALTYSLTREVSLVLGAGLKKWTLEATAAGVLGGSINASTSVDARGSDPLLYLGVQFDYYDVPIEVYYRRSQLQTDNKVALDGLDVRVLLFEF